MLGHDAVAQALVDHGVDTVFAVLGDGNLSSVKAWNGNTGSTWLERPTKRSPYAWRRAGQKRPGDLA